MDRPPAARAQVVAPVAGPRLSWLWRGWAIGASLAAQVGMLGPLSTVAMGIVLLGEPMNLWVLAGTVLVLAGVFVCSRDRLFPKP